MHNRGLDGQTPIGELMTPKPDTMPGSATVLQALHQLQYGGYRNVPVVGESGEALGVLDVLTLSARMHRTRDASRLCHRSMFSMVSPIGACLFAQWKALCSTIRLRPMASRERAK